MVPSRKMTPTTIRTNGPANDRWRRGGKGAMGGGVMTGLDIFHLARRSLLRGSDSDPADVGPGLIGGGPGGGKPEEPGGNGPT